LANAPFNTEIERSVELMKAHGVNFEPGLSDQEIEAVETRHQFQFPPDLRAFLQAALPCGDGFPPWRRPDDPGLLARLRWPEEGIAFDVEHNSLWQDNWGPRPKEISQAIERAQRLVRQAPTLIPICSHRYLPSEPQLPGNPVFSVYQLDIVAYGRDLWDYLRNEFESPFSSSVPDPSSCRPIRYWADLAE
jgi:hypothetical protein